MAFFEKDLKIFFQNEELSHLASFETGKLKGKILRGLYDPKPFDVPMGSMRIATESPHFIGITSELKGADVDDKLSCEDSKFRIAAVHKDKTGVTLLELAEVIEADFD